MTLIGGSVGVSAIFAPKPNAINAKTNATLRHNVLPIRALGKLRLVSCLSSGVEEGSTDEVGLRTSLVIGALIGARVMGSSWLSLSAVAPRDGSVLA